MDGRAEKQKRGEEQRDRRRGGNQDWETGRQEVEIGVSCPGCPVCEVGGGAGRTEEERVGIGAGGGDVKQENRRQLPHGSQVRNGELDGLG